MSRYNHFSKKIYLDVLFSDVQIGSLFRNDFHLGGRRRKDIICVRTGELTYIEQSSKKEHTIHSVDNFTVSSYAEKAQ